MWQTLSIGNLVLESAVEQWISNAGNGPVFPSSTSGLAAETSVGVVTDQCIGFLCNPTCTEQIIPFRVSSVFSPCTQNVVLIYVLLLLICMWLAFIWAYFSLRLFRYRASLYWTAFETGKPLPDFGYEAQRYRILNENPSDADPDELRELTSGSPAKPPQSGATQKRVEPSTSPSFNTADSQPIVPSLTTPLPSNSATAEALPAEEDDAIDLVALAEALTSKDKATRIAAKKAYKEHQKKAAERRKLEKKNQAEREYYLKEEQAKKEFQERQAQAGLATQQHKLEEDKRKKEAKAGKKKAKNASPKQNDDDIEIDNPMEASFAVSADGPASSAIQKLQKKAEDELLLEAAANDFRKVHLMVRDVSYWAPPRKRSGIIRRLFMRPSAEYQRFQILRNIDLAAKPGNVHALMGPSGSGKSTLLDVLALIRDSGYMKGSHYINGVRSDTPRAAFLRDWLRHNVSYVRQTDVLFPRMTVREHLQHAAWLLLPQFMPDCKKLRRVQQVIELLELDSCSETICGDGGVKFEGGISGGQRRRVSVATQLLRLPACLLLDEPTTGLDSTNALLLVQSLHTLARRGGLTVVMTIHQPRNEIFSLFDQLTVLASGKIVFSGTPSEAPGHFGIEQKRRDLSVANAILDKLAEASELEINNFQASYLTGSLGKRIAVEMKAEVTDFDDDMAADLQEVLRENALGEGRWSWESPSSTGLQMWVLMSRTMRRGGFDIRKSGILAAIGGCVVGLCFLDVNTVTSKTALCYLGVATMTFLQGAFLGDRYLAEKQMYDHESSAGSAVQWTAFLANQFIRDAVTSSVEAVMFGIPVYWIGGMLPFASNFFLYLLLLILVAHVCISWDVMVEIDRDNLRAAALVNVSYVGLGALFNGFIIQISDLPVYLSWLPYCMVTYWGFAAILVNEFAGNTFNCQGSVLDCALQTGDVFIVTLNFEHVDPFVSALVLCLMSILFRSLAIMDFFLRYVQGRGKGLKRIEGGSTLEDDENTKRPVFAGQVNKLGGVMRGMINQKGDAGKRMVDQQKLINKLETERVQAAGGGSGLVYQEEWDLVAGNDRANAYRVAASEPWYQVIFLSRAVLIILEVVDVATLAVVCALVVGFDSLRYFFLAFNTFFGLFFAVQFVVSLCFLVPITPKGPRDCTWAGANDFVAFVLTIADFVLIIELWTSQAFSASSSIGLSNITGQATFLTLAGLCRVFRLIRVYNFWFKVGRYHAVRAISWLIFAEQEKEEKMKKAQGIPVPPRGGSTFTSKVNAAIQDRRTIKSMRFVTSNPMWSSHVSSGVDISQTSPPNIDPNTF